jgi:hypothetical protein
MAAILCEKERRNRKVPLCCSKNINEGNAPSRYTFKKIYLFFTFEEAWIGHVQVA